MRRALALAAFLLVVLPSFADAHVGDGRPHVQSFQELRNVDAQVSKTQVRYDLKRPSEPTLDAIRFVFDAPTGTMSYEFRRDAAFREPSFAFRVVLDELVEFTDVNGNGEYDVSDRKERGYPVGGMAWNLSQPERVDLRGQFVFNVLAVGRFGPAGATGDVGELRLQFVAHGRAMRVALAEMHPQDVKFNLNYADFPFRHPDTRLALVARIVSPAGATVAAEDSPNGTKGALVRTDDHFAFFDWALEARGHSRGEPVQTHRVIARVADRPTAHEGGGEQRVITFSYPRADLLLSHDPTMGFEYAPPKAPPVLPWTLLGGLSATLGVAFLGGWNYVRWRRTGRVPLADLVRRAR